MKFIKKPDILSVVRDRLHYEPRTGVLTWRQKYGSRAEGARAGSLGAKGYYSISIDGQRYRASRLGWLIYYGRWPEHEIDHINGVRSDDRIANLRDVPGAVNQQNKRRSRSNSRTGLMGVKPQTTGRFGAEIKVGDRRVWLGTFDTAEQAHAAYITAKRANHAGYVHTPIGEAP